MDMLKTSISLFHGHYSLSISESLGGKFCHWLIALVLRASPSFPNIIPKRDGNAWRLGSVRSSPNFLTIIPIAIAPFLLLPLGIWYAVFVMHSATGWWYLFHVWIASTLLVASLPSKQDWFVAMPAIICAVVIFVGLYKFGYI